MSDVTTAAFDKRPQYTGQSIVFARSLPTDTERLLRDSLPESIRDRNIPVVPLPQGNLLARVPAPAEVLKVDVLRRFKLADGQPAMLVEDERYLYLFPPQGEAPQTAKMKPDELPWSLQETGVSWTRATGRGATIAILDTGIDLTHPDFAGRVARSDARSFVASGVHDVIGHGTHCAGVACGPARPSVPPRYGIAPDARLMIGKVLDDDQDPHGFDWALLNGMIWAAETGADVISLSLGKLHEDPCEPHSTIFELVAQLLLEEYGTIVVAATGNSTWRPNAELRPIHHPADCPTFVSVAAIDENLLVAPFSCGSVCHQEHPDVAAPGVDIRSSIPTHANPRDPYRPENGTSTAAPCVAGIAALWCDAADIRGSDLRRALLANIRTLGEPPAAVGRGLVRAPAAILVDVLVMLDPALRSRIDVLTKELAALGATVTGILREIGVVAVTVDRSLLDEIRGLPGVVSVEGQRQLRAI